MNSKTERDWSFMMTNGFRWSESHMSKDIGGEARETEARSLPPSPVETSSSCQESWPLDFVQPVTPVMPYEKRRCLVVVEFTAAQLKVFRYLAVRPGVSVTQMMEDICGIGGADAGCGVALTNLRYEGLVSVTMTCGKVIACLTVMGRQVYENLEEDGFADERNA